MKFLHCAGLESVGLNSICERRDQCSHYVPWPDGGTNFNVCSPTGQPYKHFRLRASLMQPEAQFVASPSHRNLPQMSLFA